MTDFVTFQLYYVPGGTSLSLRPSFDMSEFKSLQTSVRRTQGGQMNSYKLRGGNYRLMLPLTNVTSLYASTINGWWRDQLELNLIEDGGLNNGTMSCRIKNTTIPFPVRSDGQFERFDGMIQLLSSRDVYSFAFDSLGKTVITGTIFVLDDAVYGRLDVNLIG